MHVDHTTIISLPKTIKNQIEDTFSLALIFIQTNLNIDNYKTIQGISKDLPPPLPLLDKSK